MRKLIFSPAAIIDLDNIYDYTFETWGLDQAESYVRELHAVCHDMAAGKIKGRIADVIRRGYFRKSCGLHIIFYRNPNPKTMEVVRILHQRMDIEAHLSVSLL